MDFDWSIFKAYDIRGTVPDQLTTEIAYRIGNSLAGYLKPKSIAVGRDMRISSEELFDALSEGIIDCGVDVVDLGMVSTDGLYFAVGKFGYDGGVMITASHNPSQYNGFKICRRNAEPLSGPEGLDIVSPTWSPTGWKKVPRADRLPAAISAMIMPIMSCRLSIPKSSNRSNRIDAGNGMAGKIIPPV